MTALFDGTATLSCCCLFQSTNEAAVRGAERRRASLDRQTEGVLFQFRSPGFEISPPFKGTRPKAEARASFLEKRFLTINIANWNLTVTFGFYPVA